MRLSRSSPRAVFSPASVCPSPLLPPSTAMMLPPLPLPLLFLSLPSLAAAGLFASTDRLSVPTREILDLREDITLANASSLVRTDRDGTQAWTEQLIPPQQAVPPRRRPKDPSRPPECPPCFNCLLPAFSCGNSGECNPYDGQCKCPPGFGGQDCLTPRMSCRCVLERLILI